MGELIEIELSEHQAVELLERIKSSVDNLCLMLLQMHDGSGWKALGYSSWRRFCETEFHDYSQRYLNCLVTQGRVSQQVGTIVPESHARELAKLPAEDQAGALEETKERCGENVTAGQIRETVDIWKAAEEPYVEPEEPEEDEEVLAARDYDPAELREIPEKPKLSAAPVVLRGFAAAGREALGMVLSKHDGDPVASTLRALALALKRHPDTVATMAAANMDAWAVDIEDGAF